jgi:hypothetical protein
MFLMSVSPQSALWYASYREKIDVWRVVRAPPRANLKKESFVAMDLRFFPRFLLRRRSSWDLTVSIRVREPTRCVQAGKGDQKGHSTDTHCWAVPGMNRLCSLQFSQSRPDDPIENTAMQAKDCSLSCSRCLATTSIGRHEKWVREECPCDCHRLSQIFRWKYYAVSNYSGVRWA